MEGTLHGIPSRAFSLAGRPPPRFDTAAALARKLVGLALAQKPPADTFLNINIPPLSAGEIRGFRFTCQGIRRYTDAILETYDPWGRKHFWIGGNEALSEGGEDSDEQTIKAGYVSITPIQLNMTSQEGLVWLKRAWRL